MTVTHSPEGKGLNRKVFSKVIGQLVDRRLIPVEPQDKAELRRKRPNLNATTGQHLNELLVLE